MKAVFPHQAFKIILSVMIFTVYSSLFFAVNAQANHSRLIPSETLSYEPILPLRIHEGLDTEKFILGHYQPGREISAENVQKFIAFLKNLVGEPKELTQSTAE